MRIFSIFVIRDRKGKGLKLGLVWVGVRRGGGDNIASGNIKLERESLRGKKTT
jgi:hypothetical protein